MEYATVPHNVNVMKDFEVGIAQREYVLAGPLLVIQRIPKTKLISMKNALEEARVTKRSDLANACQVLQELRVREVSLGQIMISSNHLKTY